MELSLTLKKIDMKTIAELEERLFVLRQELKRCTDPDEKASLDEEIDYLQDEVDAIEVDDLRNNFDGANEWRES